MDDTPRRVTNEPDADRTTQIRGEIEHTREEMSETIDAIQEKLRPSTIAANATDRVRQATREGVRSMADMASETANGVVDYGREAYDSMASEVRQNPIPLAMIGIGAAWLLLTNRSGSRSDRDYWERSDPARRQAEGIWRRAYRAQHGRDPARTDDYGTAAGSRGSGPPYPASRSGLIDRLTGNPVPAAMAAAGIAWLALSKSGDGTNGTAGWSGGREDETWRRRFQEAQARGVGSTGTSAVSDGSETEQYASRARDTANAAGERASEYAERAQDYASDTMRSIRSRGRQGRNELQRMMEDNPLLVGAGAFAAGAIIGIALPETERENEWMGEARDAVIDRAQEAAANATSQAKDAAGEMVGEMASRVVSGTETTK